ncbi:TDP-N-acetylfucosamine:lipid II N-acetylfucosaminyltransferase [Flavobacteriaceae bacterium F89]|uniref:TDP-N-acetylfucosamine:lipid II N-acetylfucosaminyltransferase n=1 Tax=Cerina litoralis TaxID=2874477 RepID=A0AAE3EWY0_9FLAO|nr:TDP-N-acetylfucosamine:lipid II N-acetylfucosaminyltransferase [Cerina litoralis]MCG2462605.1 TDP-N-acetylfucosamine:lipid II N-acetylfucosaminyltransferase [Cerina litoralis]
MNESNHLHIFHDEKFTNTIVSQFLASKVPNQSFVLIQEEGINELVYSIKPGHHIRIIKKNSIKYKELLASLPNYSTLFIHYLCDLKLEFIENAPPNTKIIWMCWGQDIHKLIIPKSYLPQTKLLLKKNHKFSEFFWEYTLPLRLLKFPLSRKGRLLKRIDYCCPVIKEDLILINRKLKLNIQYIPFHYGTLENFLGEQLNSSCRGNNILVGNSSSYASNHLDVFKELQKFNLGNRKLIVPLNYGDTEYGKEISEIGYHIFNDRFIAILSFLPIIDYNKMVASCSVAIFNHLRQQALGNILVCLWLGIRVYLNNDSPLYDSLKRKGLIVYSIQEALIIENGLALEKMADDDVAKNKVILLKEFGNVNTVDLTKQIFDYLN